MAELKTSVVVDLAGNLARRAREYSAAMSGFGREGTRSLGLLRGAAATTGQMLDRLGNRYTALLSGAAGAGTARFVIGLEQRFTRLGIQANKGADEMSALKRQIFEIAQAPDIRVDPGEITAAIEQIVEKTGDLGFAQQNIRNIGLAIQATGAQGDAIGGILAEFQKMGIIDPKQVMEALDTLNVQGKEGAFTLMNLAALGPRVVTAYTSMGRGGVGAIREMGAALQVMRQGTGSSEQAATAFEAVLRTLGDRDKIDKLTAGGIQIFDVEALKQGKEVLRPINELMVEIVQRTGGKKSMLSEVFDAEAMRAFNAAAAEFQRSGQVTSLQKFMKLQGDGTATMQDSARAAETTSAALQNLYTAWKTFADTSLTGPIQSLANALNSLSSETTGKVIQGVVTGAAVLGTAVLARKVYTGGKGIIDMFRGGGGGLAGAAGALGGVTPVYVVNMPGGVSGLPGMAGGLAKKFGGWRAGAAVLGGANLSAIGGMGAGALATAAGGVLAAGGVGYGLGALINKFTMEGTDIGNTIGEAVARSLAFFGNKEARLVLEIDNKNQVRVQNARTDGLQVDVDTGVMGSGW